MNKPKILINKSFLVGDSVLVKELLVVLKKEFKLTRDEKQLITLSTINYSAEPLTTVLKPSKYDTINFESSFRIDTILDTNDIVYEDKSNVEDDEDAYIGIKELISILENESIDKDLAITLTNSYCNLVENLTIVYKCGLGCSALHLVTGHDEGSFLKN